MKFKYVFVASLILVLPVIIIIALNIFKFTILNNPAFWTNYLVYFGTVSLGMISLYQNISLNNENKKIRNAEKISLLPFVKFKPKFYDGPATEYTGLSIEFVDDSCDSYVVIHGDITNISDYMINNVKGTILRNNKKIGKKENYPAYNFILESGETQDFTLKICILLGRPTEDDIVREDQCISSCGYGYDEFKYLIEENVKIELILRNILGFEIKGIVDFHYDYGESLTVSFHFDEVALADQFKHNRNQRF